MAQPDSPVANGDDDQATKRRARFGALPPRVSEQGALNATSAPRDIPDHLGDPGEWINRVAGGAGG